MHFKLILLLSSAISMAAAAPVANGDDTGVVMARDLTAAGKRKVQIKKAQMQQLGGYRPSPFARQWPYQEIAAEENYLENSNQQDNEAEKENFWSKANRGIDTANKLADLIGKGRDIYTDIHGPSTAQMYGTFPGEMTEKMDAHQQDDIAEKEGWLSGAVKLINAANGAAGLYTKGKNIYTDIRGPRIAQIYRALNREIAEKMEAHQQDDVAEKDGFWGGVGNFINAANGAADLYTKGRDIYTNIHGPRIAQIYRPLNREMAEKMEAHQQDETAEKDGFWEDANKSIDTANKVADLYRNVKNLYTSTPRIAQTKSLVDLYSRIYRGLPTRGVHSLGEMANKEYYIPSRPRKRE